MGEREGGRGRMGEREGGVMEERDGTTRLACGGRGRMGEREGGSDGLPE